MCSPCLSQRRPRTRYRAPPVLPLRPSLNALIMRSHKPVRAMAVCPSTDVSKEVAGEALTVGFPDCGTSTSVTKIVLRVFPRSRLPPRLPSSPADPAVRLGPPDYVGNPPTTLSAMGLAPRVVGRPVEL